MATEIRIREISENKLTPIEDTSLVGQHQESELETWITKSPSILGDDLLIIDRQRDIPGVGVIDLLCIDATGKLAVVELKRDKSAREAVAQALDYASWLNDAKPEEIFAFSKEYLRSELTEVFEKQFRVEMPDLVPQNHKIVLIASRLDASAERIIEYLRERHGMEFNVFLFQYAKLRDGREILARTVLLPESTLRSTGGKKQPTLDDLLALAKDRNISDLVEACRTVGSMWGEQPAYTYGGSFRYWAQREDGGFRMVFGVNVSGGLAKTPAGKLDVWVRPPVLGEVTGIEEARVRSELKANYSVVAAGQDACAIRLSTQDEAERLVNQLKEWSKSTQAAGPRP